MSVVGGRGTYIPFGLCRIGAPAFTEVWTAFCHRAARNGAADSNVDRLLMSESLTITRANLMHRWKVGLPPATPAYRKRRRRALVAERKARRPQRGTTATLSRSARLLQTAIVPLTLGPALIVIVLLSLGFWAMIWAAVALGLSALG